MNKPQIRFKGFEDEWQIAPYNSLCTYLSSNLTANNATLYGKYELYDANKLIGFTDFAKINQPYISIIKDGAGIGRTRILPTNSFIIGTLGAILPNEKSSLDFLHQLTDTQNFYLQSSGSTIPHIYFSQYGVTLVNFPALPEQIEIGNYFRRLDELIAEIGREIRRLEKMKQASLQKMFPRPGTTTPEIRFAGFTDEWNIKSLGEIGSTYTGLSGKNKEDFGHGDAHFVTYMNVFSNPIASAKQVEPIEIDKSQYAVRYGDVFFTTSSETPEEVGMSSVWLYDKEHIYLNSFCFGFRPDIKIDLKYFAYFLRSPFFRSKMIILAQGISRFNISKLKVMELPVLLPSFAEQEAMGNYFHNLDELITSKRLKLAKLRNIKQACLDKMFVNIAEL